MGAKIFTFFISIFFSGIVLFILFLLIFYHDIPQKTKSIKENDRLKQARRIYSVKIFLFVFL